MPGSSDPEIDACPDHRPELPAEGTRRPPSRPGSGGALLWARGVRGMRAERDPGHHAGGHPSPRPSARFGSGCGRAPVAPLPPPRRTPSRNASPSKSRPFGNTRSRPPLGHHQCVKVGVSQVRKSWCLLTAVQPTPPERHVPPPDPATATCCRSAEPRYCDMFDQQIRLVRHVPGPPTSPERHVPPPDPATATCSRSADPATATCSTSRSGYCDMFPAHRPRQSDMFPRQTRLLRHVPVQPTPLLGHVPPPDASSA